MPDFLVEMVGDVYWYTHWRIRVYLPVHLAAIATAVELTVQIDVSVYSLGLLSWVHP